MNVKAVLIAASIACVAGAGVAARADEQKVKESDVPKVVVDAVKKKYPKGTIKQWEKDTKKDDKGVETILYEAGVEDGKRKIDVECNAAGKIVAEEEVIAQDDLPAKVKKGLADSKYGKWDVKKVEKVVHDEKEDGAAYELVVTSGEQKFEVVFDKDGKITKEEEKKAKKKARKDDDDGEEDDDD